MNPGMYWICSLDGCLVVFHMIVGWDYWLSSFSGTQYLTLTKVWGLRSSSIKGYSINAWPVQFRDSAERETICKFTRMHLAFFGSDASGDFSSCVKLFTKRNILETGNNETPIIWQVHLTENCCLWHLMILWRIDSTFGDQHLVFGFRITDIYWWRLFAMATCQASFFNPRVSASPAEVTRKNWKMRMLSWNPGRTAKSSRTGILGSLFFCALNGRIRRVEDKVMQVSWCFPFIDDVSIYHGHSWPIFWVQWKCSK